MAFLAPVITWLGTYGGVVAAVAGAAATVVSTTSNRQQAKKASSAADTQQRMMAEAAKPKAPEKPPKLEIVKEKIKAKQSADAEVRQRKAAIQRNKTVFTSPMGLTGEAPTIRKKLLGQ